MRMSVCVDESVWFQHKCVDESVDERARTSTWFPRHGPEPCADRLDASAGVQIVRVSGQIRRIARYDCCQTVATAYGRGTRCRRLAGGPMLALPPRAPRVLHLDD